MSRNGPEPLWVVTSSRPAKRTGGRRPWPAPHALGSLSKIRWSRIGRGELYLSLSYDLSQYGSAIQCPALIIIGKPHPTSPRSDRLLFIRTTPVFACQVRRGPDRLSDVIWPLDWAKSSGQLAARARSDGPSTARRPAAFGSASRARTLEGLPASALAQAPLQLGATPCWRERPSSPLLRTRATALLLRATIGGTGYCTRARDRPSAATDLAASRDSIFEWLEGL